MEETLWVYLRSESNLYTVGFYEPSGKWQPESDHGSPEEAAKRVHYLNGGDETCGQPDRDAQMAVRFASPTQPETACTLHE